MSGRKRKVGEIEAPANEVNATRHSNDGKRTRVKQKKLTDLPGTKITKIETKNGIDSSSSNKEGKDLLNKITTDYESVNFNCERLNANGHCWNMKVSAWNVGGLRAWCKKGGHEFILKENPDILCLNEVKCTVEQIPPELTEMTENYKRYWNHSTEKKGYAGVALYSKLTPIKVEYGIGSKEYDKEGRIITAEYDKFFVVCVYVPNAGQGLVTLPKRLKWNELFESFIENLDKIKPVIICGDMNVAHKEIDLKNPKTNTKSAGFTIEERDGMTHFLNNGFIDTFRHFYPELEGAYTYWTFFGKARERNTGWRLDYFIVSKRFVDNICDNIIRKEVLGSDHCPITLFLES